MAAPHNVLRGMALRDRVPMSWEQYWALNESVRGEYVEGQLVVTPGPDREHQRVCRRLATAIEQVLPPGFEVDEGWNWTPVVGVNVIPDVLVYPATTDLVRYTGTPVLAVEVLSDNRSDDLVRKRALYATFGLPHFWTVDRVSRSMDVLRLIDGSYQLAMTVYDVATEIDFGIGRLTLSVGDLFT